MNRLITLKSNLNTIKISNKSPSKNRLKKKERSSPTKGKTIKKALCISKINKFSMKSNRY